MDMLIDFLKFHFRFLLRRTRFGTLEISYNYRVLAFIKKPIRQILRELKLLSLLRSENFVSAFYKEADSPTLLLHEGLSPLLVLGRLLPPPQHESLAVLVLRL